MSLDKSIKYGKEHRKPYYKSAAFDKSCRPRGGCSWCKENRLRYKKIARYNTKDQYETLSRLCIPGNRHVNRQRRTKS